MNSPLTSRLLRASVIAAAATTLLAACNKAPEDSLPVVPLTPSVSVGSQVDDALITTSVKSALLAEPGIKSFDLQVESRQGVVQISGFVDKQDQIDQALAIARSVSGVTEVQNSVSLKGMSGTAGSQIDDASVTGRVKTALLAAPGIQSLDISVLTVRGEVQLTGFVDQQSQIDQAAQIARATEGATSVKNELLLKQ